MFGAGPRQKPHRPAGDQFRGLLLHHLTLLRGAGKLTRNADELALEQRFLTERWGHTEQDLDHRIGAIVQQQPELAPALESIRGDPVAPHPEILTLSSGARAIVRPLRRRLLVIAMLQVAVAWRPLVDAIDRVMASSTAENIGRAGRRESGTVSEQYWMNEILQQTLDDLWTDWVRLFEETE